MNKGSLKRGILPFVAGVIEHLPVMTGDMADLWGSNPEALELTLRSALSREAYVASLPVVVTVDFLAAPSSGEEVLRKCKRRGITVRDHAKHMLRELDFSLDGSLRGAKVEFVGVTSLQLGLGWKAQPEVVVKRALEFGLRLCPKLAGPLARLQCNLPRHSRFENQGDICFVSEPIMDDGQNPCYFLLARDKSGRWLDNLPASGYVSLPPERYLFTRQ